jgi:hypothetical protein
MNLKKARILVERCSKEYNHVRPHSAKGYKLPALEAKIITRQVTILLIAGYHNTA